jgi:2-polyprenyl-3-methyl-5-hydroxy-6-metoxy-1,4-benzoquinol methylase
MSEMDNNLDTEVRLWQEKLFSRSIRRKRKFERITELVGSLMNLQCLEVSSGDGVISSNLRKIGGSWKTAVLDKEASDSLAYSLKEPVTLLDNGKLPFEDHAFDRLVIVDALRNVVDDYAFLHECHRVIKNDGWVIISETRRAPVSLVALLQRIFGLSPVSNGKQRNGYKEQELFNNLKDGFDVPETICYSNGLFESAATIGEQFQKMITQGPYWLVRGKVIQEELYRYRKLYGMIGFAYPLLWLLSKLEFLPGHKLLFKSRRRHWRPRLQPKLIDGRSIAEAAINTKIGTAAPF